MPDNKKHPANLADSSFADRGEFVSAHLVWARGGECATCLLSVAGYPTTLQDCGARSLPKIFPFNKRQHQDDSSPRHREGQEATKTRQPDFIY